MGEYDDTNRGALFKNDRKAKDTQPDYTGSLDVDGKKFRLSAWLKVSKAGRRFMSISVTPREEDTDSRPVSTPAVAEMNDEIPF